MKKTFAFLTLLCGIFIISQAQVNPHTIGLRIGGDDDIQGAEISYQHGIGPKNRLEFDLGWSGSRHSNRLMVAGIYHWDWNIKDGLNWYVGPGAGIGLYRWRDDDDNKFDDSYVNLAIGGQIGIEYDFNHLRAPILLSLDFRPMWDFLNDKHSGFGWGLALGIRYTF